jgi:toxin FitB
VNTEVAKVAGVLADRARAIGHNPGLSDVLIAATAQTHGAGLMTNNTKHFVPLNLSVPLLNPFEQALPGKS